MVRETQRRIDRLRKELVDFTIALFTYSSVIVVPIFYWRVSQERETGYLVAEILPFVIAAALVGLHLAREKLTPIVRALILSGLLLVCSVAGLIARGILGPAFCFMLLAVICLCLILPLRQMLLAAVIIFAANLAVVLLHLSGELSINIDPAQAFAEPASWLAYLLVPLYASVLIVFTFSRFNESLVDTLEELEAERATIAHMANHDPLTDLPNMRVMEIRAKQAFAMARRGQARPALLFIDLDEFKSVNDELGHDVGDMLLKEVSVRIQQLLREEDTVARSGGDEFLVLITHFKEVSDVLYVAEKICAAMTEPFSPGGHECRISCSIGIAHYPEHGDDLQSLSRMADRAMYSVKRSGKKGFRIWQGEDLQQVSQL
jgi:diguanylate cyclase (GGDEF)-like protein